LGQWLGLTVLPEALTFGGCLFRRLITQAVAYGWSFFDEHDLLALFQHFVMA
jgi:hypothetical protein